MSNSSVDAGRAASVALLVAVVMIGQQLAGRAIRDGFFLTHFSPDALPTVMTVSSLLSVAIVLGSARLLSRYGPAQSVPYLFGASAVLFLGEWALSGPAPKIAAFALYLHTTSFGAVMVSGFWSIINERFDPYTAKDVVARIAGGATLGGMLGGVAAWSTASVVPVPTMILGLAILNLLCIPGLRIVGTSSRPQAEPESKTSASEILLETPYLRQLALLVGLTAFASALYDYVFKQHAAAYFAEGPDLVSFFGLFYLVLSVVTFLVQNLLSRRWLVWFGLALTVATLPATVVLLGAAAVFLPGLATAATMRGGLNVVESSLYRSGYELLYTPLVPHKKRATKTLVDVGGDKLGGAVGGGVAFFALGIFPGIATPILVCLGIGAGMAALLVSRQLHSGYVDSLAESLREGVVDLEGDEHLDDAERYALGRTLHNVQGYAAQEISRSGFSVPGAELSHEELMRLLSQRGASRSPSGPERARPYTQSIDSPPAIRDELVLAIEDLRSNNPTRIEDVFRRHAPLMPQLVPHVVPLLEGDKTLPLAYEALARVAPVHVGFLLDRVLQIRTKIEVRRALCSILGTVPTSRSAEGLCSVLLDPELQLRFTAAAGLSDIYSANAQLKPPKDLLFEASSKEARVCSRILLAQNALGQTSEASQTFRTRERLRASHGLAYVFFLLLTVLDRSALQLAIQALAEADLDKKGTGLEYLENVLTPTLRTDLWPLLQDADLVRQALRDRSDILLEIVNMPSSSKRHLDEIERRGSESPDLDLAHS